jgi:hypothetical protein
LVDREAAGELVGVVIVGHYESRVEEVGADVLFQHDLSVNRGRGLVEGWAARVEEDFILRECVVGMRG